jgi:hypothetical protein
MTFAVTRTGTVYRSDDAGVTWFAVGAVSTSSAVAITELDQLDLFVLTEEGLIASSQDLGATWSFVGTTNQVGMTALTVVDGVLFASTKEGHVAMSDNAIDWTWEGTMNQLTVRALAHDTPTRTGVPEQTPTPVLRLLPPWPNPARGTTNLAFELDREGEVTVQVFDLQGRLVDAPLLRASLPEGTTRLEWQPPSARTGIYYVKAQLGDEVRTRKIVWLERGRR